MTLKVVCYFKVPILMVDNLHRLFLLQYFAIESIFVNFCKLPTEFLLFQSHSTLFNQTKSQEI